MVDKILFSCLSCSFVCISIRLSAFTAPGVVSVSVSSITASSISLSWSVASGSVASWEVVWRETDRGTESSSGSLTGTSYTIDQLESTTIYTVTVRASNAVGASSSQPITFSTGKHELCSVIVVPCSLFQAPTSKQRMLLVLLRVTALQASLVE